MFDNVITQIKSMYGEERFIPLHEPQFLGNEKKYLEECIDSTFVSSVGEFVDRFEKLICDYTGAKYAVAVTNGTAALHTALLVSDVKEIDEVLTQALTFVATPNAISYIGASPIFIDSAEDNLGMCPVSLKLFLDENAEKREDGFCYNKNTNKRIKACVPMHTFGHPVKLDEIIKVCKEFNISVVEDAAESLGSLYKNQHTGTIAPIGILSFNGNKIITCGGGGVLLFHDELMAKRARHLTTTAKIPHRWKFDHDEIGYNYRMPNLNAALACAQIEMLEQFVFNKRETAFIYKSFFSNQEIAFIDEPAGCKSNFWLNAIMLKNEKEKEDFLKALNDNNVMVRPVWKLVSDLNSFKNCQKTSLINAKNYEARVVNIPSSVRNYKI